MKLEHTSEARIQDLASQDLDRPGFWTCDRREAIELARLIQELREEQEELRWLLLQAQR